MAKGELPSIHPGLDTLLYAEKWTEKNLAQTSEDNFLLKASDWCDKRRADVRNKSWTAIVSFIFLGTHAGQSKHPTHRLASNLWSLPSLFSYLH